MSAELNLTEDCEELRTPCGVCKKMMIVQVPRDPTVREILNSRDGGRSLLQVFAHEECVNDLEARRKMAEERARRAAIVELWKKICPDEFLKPIDWQLCAPYRKQYAEVMKWEFGSRGIIASGRTGRCKTRFMFKLLEREVFNGRNVVFVRHPEFREKVSRLSYESAGALYQYLKPIRSADIVLFDDLGKGRITEASEEAIESLIDERTRNDMPILFTTNDSDESLSQRLSRDRGEPMLRRIMDFCEPIDFGFE